MPASNPDLERRVERNTNDILAIYEILTDHGRRLATIEGKVTAIEGKVTAIEGKVTAIEGKVTAIENTLAAHGGQLAEILKRLPPVA